MSRRGTQKWSSARRARVRRSLLAKYGPVCQWCWQAIDMDIADKDDPMHWSVDHIKPWAQGGSNKIGNLQPMHHACNLAKSLGHDAPALS